MMKEVNMKTLHINVRDTLLNKEKALLVTDIRASSDKLASYLTPDFEEICSSGAIYKFKLGDTLLDKNTQLQEEPSNIEYKITDFELHILSNECVQVTYKLIQSSTIEKDVASLRSSIWVRVDDNWKRKFHQGTPISE